MITLQSQITMTDTSTLGDIDLEFKADDNNVSDIILGDKSEEISSNNSNYQYAQLENVAGEVHEDTSTFALPKTPIEESHDMMQKEKTGNQCPKNQLSGSEILTDDNVLSSTGDMLDKCNGSSSLGNIVAHEIASDIKSEGYKYLMPSPVNDLNNVEKLIEDPKSDNAKIISNDESITSERMGNSKREDEESDEDFDIDLVIQSHMQESDTEEFDVIEEDNTYVSDTTSKDIKLQSLNLTSETTCQLPTVGIGFLSGPTISEDIDLLKAYHSSSNSEIDEEGDLGVTATDRSLHEMTDAAKKRHSTENVDFDLVDKHTVSHIDNSKTVVISDSEQSRNHRLSDGRVSPPHELQGIIELEAAQAEWDTIQTVTPEMAGDMGLPSYTGIVCASVVKTTPLISYKEAIDYFKTSDLLQRFRAGINPTSHRSRWNSFKHMLFGAPKLHRDLVIDRDIVFCLAACPFENHQEVHFRMLQTLYKRLTGSKFDCQRYGDHWEQIGFQGCDPSTDLRGTGILGLMTLLYMVMDPKTLPLARDIYKLSLHEVQNFPFCLMGINMTRIVLQTIRDETLNKEFNKQNDVIGIVNHLYVATYYHMYHIWKTQHKNITHSGFVIKEVEMFVKKNYRIVLRNLDEHLHQRKSAKGPSLTTAATGTGMSFTGVTELSTGNEDDGNLI